ncbi:MAG: undecaprenyldiphospho-muramoylpentapeptide beta-N-acetylglucosaminyltransferase [Clostridia bacterium]|nr:undecaprenyldiphospho-muramoylpentapeptide beta-N-acetylglucosaminyltransferase [Clostridia bacterium]
MRVILAGGGTAGHCNPALAIAGIIKAKNKDAEILFIGNRGKIEETLVGKAGYPFRAVQTQGFRRKLTLDNFKTVQLYLKAKKDCKAIIKEFKPDVVIGTGGYVSGPVVAAAQSLGVPTCIHEQNAYPGVTSKMLAGKADIVFISFPGSEKYFGKTKKMVLSGNPLREEVLNTSRTAARAELAIPEEAFYLLSFAGSLGAAAINGAMVDFIARNAEKKDFYQTHATGERGWEDFSASLKEKGFDSKENTVISVQPYLYDMHLHLAAADAVISRAGAITLGELTALGKPAILIPSPNVTHNHQYYNARSLSDRGGAILLEEKELSAERLYETVLELKENPSRRKELGQHAAELALPQAAETIYNEVYDLIRRK